MQVTGPESDNDQSSEMTLLQGDVPLNWEGNLGFIHLIMEDGAFLGPEIASTKRRHERYTILC